MGGFDITVLALAGSLFVIGLWKGLVRILVGLAALVVAFVLASRFHLDLAARCSWTGWSEGTIRTVSYLAIFLGVMLAGGLLAWLARKLVKAAMLGWADRMAGATAGLAVATLAAALLILPVVAYLPRGDGILERSVLAPYIAAVADLANRVAPEDLSQRYRERMDSLRRRWQKGTVPAGMVRATDREQRRG